MSSLKMPKDLTSAMRRVDDLDRLERPKPDTENITILQTYQQDSNKVSNTDSNIDSLKDDLLTSHTTSLEDDLQESQPPVKVTAQPTTKTSSHRTILSGGNTFRKLESQKAGKSADSLIIQEADRLASSAPTAITVKLADELNDWVDEIAHKLRKSKIKKQDIITLAVKRLYVDVERNGGALPEDV